MNPQLTAKKQEHYTPAILIESVRKVLGSIDLDPATSEEANKVVRAANIFTAEDNGLIREWKADRVFLNPPGGKTGNKSNQGLWWDKLCSEYDQGNLKEAIFLGFSLELLSKRPAILKFSTCVIHQTAHNQAVVSGSGRIKFDEVIEGVRSPQNSPTHGNFITYLPPKNSPGLVIKAFEKEFQKWGTTVMSIQTIF